MQPLTKTNTTKLEVSYGSILNVLISNGSLFGLLWNIVPYTDSQTNKNDKGENGGRMSWKGWVDQLNSFMTYSALQTL